MSRATCPKCGNTDVSWIRDDADCAQYICLECKQCFCYPPKTLFTHITVSPEVLAPKLVFCAEYKTIRPMYLEGKGGIIVGEVWKSTVISGASFKTEPEAIAATVAKLKEVLG